MFLCSQFSHFNVYLFIRSCEISAFWCCVLLPGIMEWAAQVSEIIQSSGPILSRYTGVMELLEKNLQTTQQRILPGLIMAHPQQQRRLGSESLQCPQDCNSFPVFCHIAVFPLCAPVIVIPSGLAALSSSSGPTSRRSATRWPSRFRMKTGSWLLFVRSLISLPAF